MRVWSLMFCGLSLASFAQDAAPASATGSSASAVAGAGVHAGAAGEARATGRVSVFTDDGWWMSPDIGTAQRFGQVISSASFHAADTDGTASTMASTRGSPGSQVILGPTVCRSMKATRGSAPLDGTLRVRAGNVAERTRRSARWPERLQRYESVRIPHSSCGGDWSVFGGLEPKILDFRYLRREEIRRVLRA